MIAFIKGFVGGWKSIAIASAASLAIGFIGGWKANAGKHALDAVRAKNAQIEALVAERDALADKTAAQAERIRNEQEARDKADERLEAAYRANADLARSRSSQTTRIIERGQEIGDALADTNPCIREPWPISLRLYANGGDDAEGLPVPSAGDYP